MFEDLKQRQSVMWGSAPYENVAESLADMHDLVVGRLAPKPGERWLDIGCGTGALARRAAAAGAVVTAVDLAPALVETAKRETAEAGLEVEYRVGDAERLEGIDDGAYDVVSSTIGMMFAPDHAAAARQLKRVTRSGGRLGLANWLPAGGVGEMFRMLAPFQPPPAADAGNALDWGREEYVEELLGDAFELSFEQHVTPIRTGSAEEYWKLMADSFGPIKTLAETLGDRREELHRTWLDFFESRYREDGGIVHPREYLLVLGTRR